MPVILDQRRADGCVQGRSTEVPLDSGFCAAPRQKVEEGGYKDGQKAAPPPRVICLCLDLFFQLNADP